MTAPRTGPTATTGRTAETGAPAAAYDIGTDGATETIGTADAVGGLGGQYRQFMSGFPSGVAVITAVGADNGPRGLTCTSLASITLTPPTLLVSLDVRSGTLAALRDSRRFGVNLLHAEACRAAEVFASPGADRFGRVTWRRSAEFGLPCLTEDSTAFAQCVATAMHLVGDHMLVFGEVDHVRRLSDRVPLLYGLRSFCSWPGPDPEAAPVSPPPGAGHA